MDRIRIETDAACRPVRVATWTLVFVVLASTAFAQTAFEQTREEAMTSMLAALRNGNVIGATEVVRAYVETHPCDALMQFNMACLQTVAGEIDEAAAALDLSFRLGYAPLDQAKVDPDLAGLRENGVVDSLVTHHRAVRLEERRSRSLELEEGAWSTSLALRTEAGGCSGELGGMQVRFRSDPEGLRLEFDPGPHDVDDLLLQWVVGVPASLETVRTPRARVFVGPPGTSLDFVRWNGFDLGTDGDSWKTHVTHEGDRIVHEVSWSALSGFGPPLDPVIATNVRVIRRDDPRVAAAVVSDPFVGSITLRERRHTDLRILPAEPPAPWVRGRLVSNAVIGDSLAVDLVLQGTDDGEATLFWTVDDGESTHEFPAQQVDTYEGISFTAAVLDASLLGDGAQRLSVEARVDGTTFGRWAAEFLRLSPSWFVDKRRIIEERVRPVERAPLQYRLFQVLNALRNPMPDGPIVRTMRGVDELAALLDLAEGDGTAIPGPVDRPSAFTAAYAFRGELFASTVLHRPARGSAEENGPVVLTVVNELTDDPSGGDGHPIGSGLLHSSSLPTSTASLQVVTAADPRVSGGIPVQIAGALDWVEAYTGSPADVVAIEGRSAVAGIDMVTMGRASFAELRVLLTAGDDPRRLVPPDPGIVSVEQRVSIVLGVPENAADAAEVMRARLTASGHPVTVVAVTSPEERSRFLAGAVVGTDQRDSQ